MGRLVVTEYVTLDGVVEAPGGGEDFVHAGWTFRFNRGPEGDAFKLDETRNSDALLFGRVTYEGMAAAWPNMTGEFADLFNGLPKFVVSNTLTDASWNNTEVLRGDLRTDIEALKSRFGGNIVLHGSPSLVQGLLDLDVIDEMRLMLFPIVLGQGKRLFGAAGDPKQFRLAQNASVGDGIAVLTYVRA
jgi:dihydrofolate reductase